MLFEFTIIILQLFFHFPTIHAAGAAGAAGKAGKVGAAGKAGAAGVVGAAGQQGNLKVTLSIYSGRSNPRWDVLSGHPKFGELKKLLDKARTEGFAYKPEFISRRLGYRGFLVKEETMKTAELIVGQETVALQELLLETCPKDLLPEASRQRVLVVIKADSNVKPEENTGNAEPGNVKPEQNKGNTEAGNNKPQENKGNTEAGNNKPQENTGNLTGRRSMNAD